MKALSQSLNVPTTWLVTLSKAIQASSPDQCTFLSPLALLLSTSALSSNITAVKIFTSPVVGSRKVVGIKLPIKDPISSGVMSKPLFLSSPASSCRQKAILFIPTTLPSSQFWTFTPNLERNGLCFSIPLIHSINSLGVPASRGAASATRGDRNLVIPSKKLPSPIVAAAVLHAAIP